MKRIYLAAGALLLGTSAYAWAPSTAPVAQDDKAPIAVSDAKAPVATLVAKSNDLPKVALAAASAEAGDKPVAADSDLDLAVAPDSLDKGMGGPLEEVTKTASVETAAANYPPCRPGPGDDHCIQLYEPGVRAALASWNPPADTTLAAAMGETPVEATGVGGPYEPVDAAVAAPMNGDGLVDAASGESAEVELASAGDYSGVGGPVAETGYPPCSPGPGDDRCIQLYERGVTGAGN